MRVQLAEEVGSLHVCSIYHYPFEKIMATVEFFRECLGKKVRCVCFMEKSDFDKVVEELEKRGVDAHKFIDTGDLVMIDNRDAYMDKGGFAKNKVLSLAEKIESEALSGGCKSVRIVGEIPIVSTGAIELEKLLEYEKYVDGFLGKSKIRGMCHYCETEYDQEFLSKMMNNHKHLMIYGRCYENTNVNGDVEEYQDILDRLMG